MKKSIRTTAGILLAAILAAGCGNDGFVKGKEHETVREAIRAPERWEEEPFASGDGRMQVEADAQVQIPDVAALPIWKIGRVCMDEALATQIVQGLFGDSPVYNPYHYLGLLDDTASSQEEMGFSVESKELGNETVMNTYRGVVEHNGGVYWCELSSGVQNGSEAVIYAQREIDGWEPARWHWYGAEEAKVYEEAPGQPSLEYFTDFEEYIIHENMREVIPEVSREKMEELAGLSPEEALEQADTYVKDMGIGTFEAVSVVPVGGYLLDSTVAEEELEGAEEQDVHGCGGQETVDRLWTAELQEGAYQILYTRTVEGVPVTYERTRGGGLPEEDAGAPKGGAVYWPYEMLWFVINDEGVQYMELKNLYRLERQKAEDTELLEFSQIEKIVEEAVKEDLWKKQADGAAKSVIREAKLGYMKLYDPWSEELSGVLVPVWDFFGWQETDGETVFSQKYVSYLTVQAVNGMVLDRESGCLPGAGERSQ